MLVVDDQPEILRMIERMLGDPYDVSIAGGIDEARRTLVHDEYELVLCDIEMPGGSGLELAAELAAVHPRTSVVLVTGLDDPEIAQRGFDLGVHGYLVKPFGGEQLAARIRAVLRRTQPATAAAGTGSVHVFELRAQLHEAGEQAPRLRLALEPQHHGAELMAQLDLHGPHRIGELREQPA